MESAQSSSSSPSSSSGRGSEAATWSSLVEDVALLRDHRAPLADQGRDDEDRGAAAEKDEQDDDQRHDARRPARGVVALRHAQRAHAQPSRLVDRLVGGLRVEVIGEPLDGCVRQHQRLPHIRRLGLHLDDRELGHVGREQHARRICERALVELGGGTEPSGDGALPMIFFRDTPACRAMASLISPSTIRLASTFARAASVSEPLARRR